MASAFDSRATLRSGELNELNALNAVIAKALPGEISTAELLGYRDRLAMVGYVWKPPDAAAVWQPGTPSLMTYVAGHGCRRSVLPPNAEGEGIAAEPRQRFTVSFSRTAEGEDRRHTRRNLYVGCTSRLSIIASAMSLSLVATTVQERNPREPCPALPCRNMPESVIGAS